MVNLINLACYLKMRKERNKVSIIKTINERAEKLISENKELLILDVRTFSEYKSGKIPNSINIPVDELDWELERLEPYTNKEILIYCKAGIRSSVACNYLENEGFKKLYNLRGGTIEYTGELIK